MTPEGGVGMRGCCGNFDRHPPAQYLKPAVPMGPTSPPAHGGLNFRCLRSWQSWVPLAAGLLLAVTAAAAERGNPWRLNDVLGLPAGWQLSGTNESRFENLADDVQAGASANDQVLAIRTTLDLQYQAERFTAQLELSDSRQALADQDSFLKNRTVNTADILQANLGFRFGGNNRSYLRIGRFSEDWGNRKLVSRNRFRNTINNWEGVVLHHRGTANSETRVMATQVVRRRPTSFAEMLDNRRQSDVSSSAQRFYGLFTSLPELFSAFATELYYYGLREKDTPAVQTANRNLHSIGFRLHQTPQAAAFDYELQTVYQFGDSNATADPADTVALDHEAHFQFLAIGYSFAAPSSLRLILELNYASGDADPFDQRSGGFDDMFGQTTTEFGVVGLYDIYNRRNLFTPGIRLTANLLANVDLMASYRHFWLAEKRDTWGRTGLRDLTGQSGRYMGQHLELRLRWNPLPGNLRIVSGIILGQTKNLSNNNPRYFYLESELMF